MSAAEDGGNLKQHSFSPNAARMSGSSLSLTCHTRQNILTSLKTSLTNPLLRGKEDVKIIGEKEKHLEEKEIQWDVSKRKHEPSETNLHKFLLRSVEGKKILH